MATQTNVADILKRIAIPSAVAFAYWGTAWIFLLGSGSWYLNQASYHPVGINLWLFETVIPILPGLGALAGLFGLITRDKQAAFLLGVVPNVLNFIIYLAMPSFGFVQVYPDGVAAVSGFLTLLFAGIGLGLIGLAGCFYRDFKEGKNTMKSARLTLLLAIVGLFSWLFIMWIGRDIQQRHPESVSLSESNLHPHPYFHLHP